ncbi:sugar phosphate isomerase/epimerase [Homoserinimonas aerilata]|uniref:Sugar phosphate isomerase/epimerase n=1 Tax=Homoserinimonas aerilata TaxID=1162970 RepID=A0A542YHC8_9MICO|nr:sugar phosphate isomerase/epimerase [Homoserinimonas aerilata]TQL47499.1 sugar phosphate isomerase/epimerase [Homoserinimonas aerilata]
MIRVGLSTSSVYPLSLEHAFRLAGVLGYDGVEVMVTNDERTRDASELLRLSMKYELPILSIHAPVLLLTTFVWGRDPQVKLEKSAELARAVGASTVVVHPPFRWQAAYAKDFLRIVRSTAAEYGVEIAVENMFPWKVGSRSLGAYSPGYDPTLMDCDAMTLDFSHASLSGRDSLELAHAMGGRLRHVHLCDGSGSMDEGRVFDEHLLPGRGSEPVAEVLQYLSGRHWKGSVVAEVNTRRCRTEEQRLELLSETLAFARSALGQRDRRPVMHRPLGTVLSRIRRRARRGGRVVTGSTE